MSSSGSFFDFHQRVSSRRPTSAAPVATATPLTVSELTQRIDGVVRAGFPGVVQVRGEVSNCRPNAASGHCYFTLKDARACLSCVLFRGEAAKLRFQLRDGMDVLATGRVTVYAAQGKHQLNVDRAEPLGQGALELAFQQLRAKLEAEELFARERKRAAIPQYPLRIALVTSAGAAALHDMLKVLRRCPWLRLTLVSVPVQGDGAAVKIAAALSQLSRRPADVVLLARGGGSLEDLWQFNDEALARVIAACPVPVITGIGHEVDVSIADLVADYHAHTPTEAAQIVVQFWKHARDDLDQFGIRLRRGLRGISGDARHRLNNIERHEVFRRPLERVERLRQLLDDRERQADHAIDGRLRQVERRVVELKQRLDAQSPQALVERLRQRLNDTGHRLRRAALGHVRAFDERLQNLDNALRDRHPRHEAAVKGSVLNGLQARFDRAMATDQQRRSERVAALAAQLKLVNPENVLARGYSVTTLKKSGVLVRDASQLKPGDRLLTRLATGVVESTVDDGQLPLFG